MVDTGKTELPAWLDEARKWAEDPECEDEPLLRGVEFMNAARDLIRSQAREIKRLKSQLVDIWEVVLPTVPHGDIQNEDNDRHMANHFKRCHHCDQDLPEKKK